MLHPAKIIPLFLLGLFVYWHTLESFKAFLQVAFPKAHLNFILPRYLHSDYRQYLPELFPFYNKLNPKEKRLFERRMQFFIHSKRFYPRGGLTEIPNKILAKIAGTAVMLTYGYPDVFLVRFHSVLVYPDDYYSKITKKYHRGHVDGRGIICLSIKALNEGFKNQNDGVNLAIHEMAHAIRLENAIRNQDHGFIPVEDLAAFDRLALAEIRSMKSGNPSFFRSYAKTNRQEFFAVVLENYFERGEAFRKAHPELFLAVSKILRIPV